MILEKNYFKKILIAMLSLTLVLFLTVAPVYASHTVSEEKVEISLRTDKASETAHFYNAEMVSLSQSIYNITFDAEFAIEVSELDQVVIDQNFSEIYVSIISYFNIFTGFEFDFVFYDNQTDENITHTGRVNMINNGDLSSTNMLDGFSDAVRYYQIFLRGNSTLASEPENTILREIYVDSGIKVFPIASSSSEMRGIEIYGSSNNINKYLLGEDGDYLNFQPTEVVLKFEGLSFLFNPFQANILEGGNGLIANGYDDVEIPEEQTLTNFNYDHEVKVEAMTPDFPGLPPSVPRTDFRFDTTLRFENESGVGGGVGGDGYGPGSGSLFSIIPSIMVAIFSFFWMIGSVELGGIQGLTLVSITTFFVSFMVIKFIIGLFKGGGD